MNCFLFKEKTNDIISVDKCLLLNDKINDELIKLELFIHRYKNNNINEIMIRVINDKIMLSLDTINKEVRDSFIKFESDEKQDLSSFLEVKDSENKYIAQVVKTSKNDDRYISYASRVCL